MFNLLYFYSDSSINKTHQKVQTHPQNPLQIIPERKTLFTAFIGRPPAFTKATAGKQKDRPNIFKNLIARLI